MSQRTVKLKGSFFFPKERWKTVRELVEILNKVIMRATMLAKIYVPFVGLRPSSFHSHANQFYFFLQPCEIITTQIDLKM